MIDIVIGTGFGDEGKGQTVSNLINRSTGWVIRFNGGQQAGHTVEYNGMRHIFSNFGAGTLQGVSTYWSKYCTIHPKAIKAEWKVLKNLDRDMVRNKSRINPTMLIDPLSPVTLPHDILLQNTKDHGTVGVGFGQTLQRNEDHFKLFAADLLNEAVLKAKIKNIEEYYYHKNLDLSEFYDECDWLVNGDHDISIGRPQYFAHVIFEGAQGVLLDEEYGFFPNVTRSKTTALNAFKIIKDWGLPDLPKVHYVSRAYSTRHGNGPFPQGKHKDLLKLKDNILESNTYNTYQGHFRKSILDLDLVDYAINLAEQDIVSIPHVKRKVFTCLDHIKGDTIPVIREGNLEYIDKKDFS